MDDCCRKHVSRAKSFLTFKYPHPVIPQIEGQEVATRRCVGIIENTCFHVNILNAYEDSFSNDAFFSKRRIYI